MVQQTRKWTMAKTQTESDSHQKETHSVFICGGGTGGHVYPGVAFAQGLQEINPKVSLLFVGSFGGLEEQIVPREKFPLLLLPAGKFNLPGRPWTKLLSLFKLCLAIAMAMSYLLRLRPDWVLGVGGFASVPMVLAAQILRKLRLIPTRSAVWEPNAFPGLANRLLAPRADELFVVFKKTLDHLGRSGKVLGMPIRKEIVKLFLDPSPPEQKSIPDGNSLTNSSSTEVLRILVIGGSQGSKQINSTMVRWIESSSLLFKKRISICHQTGAQDFESTVQSYIQLATQKNWKFDRKEGLHVQLGTLSRLEVKPFIYNMPEVYQATDIAVSRAGASSAAELAAAGVIPVFIPLAAADDHQLYNALEYKSQGAAFCIPSQELTWQRLESSVDELMDYEKRMSMRDKLRTLFKPNGAQAVAHELLGKTSIH